MLARSVLRTSSRAVLRPVVGARAYSLLRPDVFGDQQNQMDYSNEAIWRNNLLFQERIVDSWIYNPALDKSKGDTNASLPTYSSNAKASIPEAVSQPRASPVRGLDGKVQTSESSRTSVRYAAFEEQGPLSTVSFVVNGGSRFEAPNQSGFSHLFKSFAFKGTKDITAFRIVREFESRGVNLYISVTREHITFTAQFLRNHLPEVLPVLKEIVTKTDFQDYKLEKVVEVAGQESEYFNHKADVVAFDALHRAAFRSGLGNPVFASEASISGATSEGIAEYAAARTVEGETTVVGHNVSIDELVSLAEPLFESGKSQRTTPAPSKYYGGSTQLQAATSSNQSIVAFEAPAAGAPGFFVAQVLRGLLGNTASVPVKWGSSAAPLAQPVRSSAEDADAAAFHLAYSDSGLFGLHAQGSGSKSRDALKAAFDLLKSVADGKATEKDLARAKNAAKVAASRDSAASRVDFVEDFGRQVASTGKYVGAGEAFAAIEQVSLADVTALASKLVKSKPTIAYVGDLNYAVYADTLGL